MKELLCLLTGYTFGCFQTSYIVVKHCAGEDIRCVGSGNAGTMNTLLSFGRAAGAVVLFGDMLKTIVPAILCILAFPEKEPEALISVCSLGVFLGHCFPFWLGFRGGKGVAVAAAFALILDLRVFLFSVIVAGVFGLLRRSAAYSSYTFAIMLFVCAVSFGCGTTAVLCALFESIAIVLLHLSRKRSPQKNSR